MTSELGVVISVFASRRFFQIGRTLEPAPKTFSEPTFIPSVLKSGRAQRYVCVARWNSSSSRRVCAVSAVGRFSANGRLLKTSKRATCAEADPACMSTAARATEMGLCMGFVSLDVLHISGSIRDVRFFDLGITR